MNAANRLLTAILSTAALLAASPCLAKEPVDPRLAQIDHWIVIYQENWSFDSLYGNFPRADGLKNAAPTVPQVDRFGRRLVSLPELSSDPNIPPGLPVGPFDLSQYADLTTHTKDLVHQFYTEQLQ